MDVKSSYDTGISIHSFLYLQDFLLYDSSLLLLAIPAMYMNSFTIPSRFYLRSSDH